MEALEFRMRHGGDMRIAACSWAEEHGYLQIPPEEAYPGDLGLLVHTDGKGTMATCLKQGWAMRAEKGFAISPMVTVAWRIK